MTIKSTRAPLVIEPENTAKSAIIWLHGLGADADDFAGIVPLLPTEKFATRMIFPNAPIRPVTVNMGAKMPAWYDISDMNFRNADKQGIGESHQMIQSLIDEQVQLGISSEKIVLAGFSQGGAMALHSGLRCPQKLAGILALSCYVLERNGHAQQIESVNMDTPIWMAHGTNDPVVAYSLGESSNEFLAAQGHHMTFVSYPMAHEVTMPEITALATWISEVLA